MTYSFIISIYYLKKFFCVLSGREYKKPRPGGFILQHEPPGRGMIRRIAADAARKDVYAIFRKHPGESGCGIVIALALFAYF